MEETDSAWSSTSGCKRVIGLGAASDTDGAIQRQVFLLVFQGQLHPLTQRVFRNSAMPSTTVSWYLQRDALEISLDQWRPSPLSAPLSFL